MQDFVCLRCGEIVEDELLKVRIYGIAICKDCLLQPLKEGMERRKLYQD